MGRQTGLSLKLVFLLEQNAWQPSRADKSPPKSPPSFPADMACSLVSIVQLELSRAGLVV